ncbi:hypothetical protein A2291_07020 [candidate division WOR-1 bacterium RIFOXYB2_FULL_42_35]|uniref:Hydrogenase n=1 Tax=candidate division WOR-1 bacterium RIFOXYC2_FULL_41_25 TaxID=1802586 RepID=A0A1F4TRN7_UNCSA|nr:MAG: hypothetical protein A2247_04860 [candidate division WOR-1 bacterium RIFOXYA2_FULL_41_14]OGC25608.1 MAG: hypothetical protein A2291_07020 [candidate division WOR-1 bacterium RIFOXYB2_FULL_42_35]OGC35318.1 MAG: hypothetical protein A2462_02485 [candidate division WOR-1 bacterium RIFOXYC2_FULL_41_25]OGC41970.1 MAG: hypothetical protein A2548_07040 [candidate division WOR-1 bacterium RIFOXYD2_FULL_41_8]
MEFFLILGLLASAFGLVSAKRLSVLIGNFSLQSLLLAILTFVEAVNLGQLGLCIIALLVLALKVVIIPKILSNITKEIKVNDNLEFYLNPQLSLLMALLLTYLCWTFASVIFVESDAVAKMCGAVSFSMIALGMFLMIFRVKALAQIIGLLAMENGVFLLAALVLNGMPFLVEMAIFFDVFVGVVILGVFVYRINRLFVGIDVSKLNRLRG